MVLELMAARRRHAFDEPSKEARVALSRLADARQHLSSLWVRGPETGDPEDFRHRLEAARVGKEDAERALAKLGTEYRQRQAAPEITLAEVREALPPHGALVEIVRVGVRSTDTLEAPLHDVALILGPSDSGSFVDLGPSRRIDERVVRWRTALESAADHLSSGDTPAEATSAIDETGARLREVVWDPIVDRIADAETVFLVPDGSLHHVDFKALPAGGGKFVVESGPRIQLLSTGRDLVRFARPATTGQGGLLAVGAPEFDAEIPDAATLVAEATTRSAARSSSCAALLDRKWSLLPESGEEIRRIGELFGKGASVRLLTAETATESAFKLQAPGRRVVHLATHGFFLDRSCDDSPAGADNPLLLSGLVFAGANRSAAGDQEDGVLTAEELVGLDLDGVELVVLSGCETGLGGVVRGQGVLGLRRALEIAGARTVVMSLWKVRDRATRRWMTNMYTEWLDGAPVAEAVHRASLAALDRLRRQRVPPHPYLWSGFVVAGDWR